MRQGTNDSIRSKRVSLGRTVAIAGACAAFAVAAQAQVKSYDSTKKDFWEHPPADWFLGDETPAQKGLAPPANPALPVKPVSHANRSALAGTYSPKCSSARGTSRPSRPFWTRIARKRDKRAWDMLGTFTAAWR